MRGAAWLVGCLIVSCGLAFPASAQNPPPGIAIELNKLEAADGACRIYLLLENRSADNFDALTLELVSFGRDGVIGQRLAVDLAPLRPRKTAVKLFDLPGTGCSDVSRVLVNDVSACSAATKPLDDCLDRLEVKGRGDVALFK